MLSSGKATFPISGKIYEIKSELIQLEKTKDPVSTLKSTELNADLVKLGYYLKYDERYSELNSKRKLLQSKNLRDTHYTTGIFLLSSGILVTILGTYKMKVIYSTSMKNHKAVILNITYHTNFSTFHN